MRTGDPEGARRRSRPQGDLSRRGCCATNSRYLRRSGTTLHRATCLWRLLRRLQLLGGKWRASPKGRQFDATLMTYHTGSNACFAWTATEPWIQYMRESDGEEFACDFEWFVQEVVGIDPTLATDLGQPRSRYAGGVGTLESLIATEVELRH